MQVKLWHDACEEGPSSSAKASAMWQEILEFWDFMSQAPEYRDIKKSDFKEKQDLPKSRVRKGRDLESAKEKALKKLRFSSKPGGTE